MKTIDDLIKERKAELEKIRQEKAVQAKREKLEKEKRIAQATAIFKGWLQCEFDLDVSNLTLDVEESNPRSYHLVMRFQNGRVSVPHFVDSKMNWRHVQNDYRAHRGNYYCDFAKLIDAVIYVMED